MHRGVYICIRGGLCWCLSKGNGEGMTYVGCRELVVKDTDNLTERWPLVWVQHPARGEKISAAGGERERESLMKMDMSIYH